MNDTLYVWVDFELNLIATLPDELPKNWKNFHGIDNLDYESLKGLGWHKINDSNLLNFNHTEEWLGQFKKQILENVASQRWKAQTEPVTYNGNVYLLNDQTINSLYQKRLVVESDPNSTFVWKTRDSMVELSSTELINLTNAINLYIQECFNTEKQFVDNFPTSYTLEDLINLNLNITWPSTELN
jgi:hypothetical protein